MSAATTTVSVTIGSLRGDNLINAELLLRKDIAVKHSLRATFLLIVTGLITVSAQAQSFFDSFEGSEFDSFWIKTEQFGAVSLTTEQAHGGIQSAKFSSSFGGQREVHLSHNFPSAQKGIFSIYFYDAAPGQETLYEKLNLYNATSGESASIGTQDFDAYCYTAQMYNPNTNVLQGPNGTCGVFPQTSTTNISRTAGWHKFEIVVSTGSVSFSIDGVRVFEADGNYSFDSVDISVSGPFWRPNTVAYFDDFSFQAHGANTFLGYFNPLLNDGMAVFQAGRTIPVKFQLAALDGSFVTDAVASIQVFRVIDTPTGTVDMSVDTLPSGSSNIGSVFRFDPISSQYIYNLSTKGYSSGTYLLRTTLSDGTIHDVNFSIK